MVYLLLYGMQKSVFLLKKPNKKVNYPLYQH